MRSIWLVLASVVLLATSPANAQDGYPSKQVTVIVPFSAGGTADIFARMVSNHLQMKLGKPFVVENVGGAGSMVHVPYKGSSQMLTDLLSGQIDLAFDNVP